MTISKLLVVEDDEGLCRQYRWVFPEHQLFLARDRKTARRIITDERPPVAILDLGLPPDPDGATEGLALLSEILELAPQAKVIVATGSEDTEHALQAVAAGAFDFCRKPVDTEVLRIIVAHAYRLYELEEENRQLRARARPSPIGRLITGDQTMLKLCSSIERLATTDVPVLILGESGTGKELLAHALHELGPRADKPFVPINCAAIPETLLESELFGHERGAFTGAVRQTIGKIEAAHRGTLFLDEIGDLPQPLQVKLLRFLQDQMIERIGGRRPIQVNVRIVCATNQDLATKMAHGEFREDLFYRLNGITVRVPPLRDRAGDVLVLANYFLNRFAGELRQPKKTFSSGALSAMREFDWPGNIRELENRVKRSVIMSEGRLIEPADLELTDASQAAPNLDLRMARMKAEREVIQLALAHSNGIVAAAAKSLGVSRPTLYSLMQEHGIEAAPRSATQDEDKKPNFAEARLE
ncbi:MAG: PEP-CTERM-box response regulator transcription factor [Deltaproteobacteria bacterium]|nr:PEP-CTERM-box response regulator transcription factor [Deltaproteobacteria bacterium]